MPKNFNYLTSPDVVVWSAVVASCAVPRLFNPVTLLSKRKGTNLLIPWHYTFHENIDGSCQHDLPVKELSALFNVTNFVVSQVNPHVTPFLPKSIKLSRREKIKKVIFLILKTELKHRLKQLSSFKFCSNLFNFLYSIISQRYHGSITIVSEGKWTDYLRIFQDPLSHHIDELRMRGEKATWPRKI